MNGRIRRWVKTGCHCAVTPLLVGRDPDRSSRGRRTVDGLVVLGGFVLVLLLGACRTSIEPSVTTPERRSANPSIRVQSIPTLSLERYHLPGIENFWALSPRIHSGSAPQGDAAFEALAKIGIRTVISVDGAEPDVETAARYGIRTVHLPMEYSGISQEDGWRLVKAVGIGSEGVYVHCHKGLHRGPTAVALLCMALEAWPATFAERWMHIAGTSEVYAGLYDSVKNFRVPSAEDLENIPEGPVEPVEVSPLVECMVQIENRFETLRGFAANEYLSLETQPGRAARNESVLLWELFREARRTGLGGELGFDYEERLTSAEVAAEFLHEQLGQLERDGSRLALATVNAALESMARECAGCHRVHRD